MKRKEDKKVKTVLWRVTEEEYRELNKVAAEAGKSVSGVLRARVFHGKEAKMINATEFLKEYKESGVEQKRIGNNLNQLAKYANSVEKAGRYEIGIIEEKNRLMKEWIGVLIKIERLMMRVLRARW